MLEHTPSRRRPSFGRPRAVRGLDLFDTPPIALAPLFAHETLLMGVTAVCEPFCGKGNLVLAMRARGLIVHASDILDRGCPDSSVRDFRAMVERPCDVLVSNPAYDGTAGGAMEFIEHAWALGFRVVVLLLKVSFLCSEQRYERLHPRGHLRRVHVLAERLHDMHDAAHVAAGGKKAAQTGVHAWFVFDRDYRGPATISPVSINAPDARMPWADPYAETMAKLLATIHDRIPMVTPDEQREIQIENAEADARVWSSLHDVHADTVSDHKGLIVKIESAIAIGTEKMAKADAAAAVAKERIAKLKRGESVNGGLGKPPDLERILREEGFTTRDLRRMRQISELGEAAFEEFKQEHLKRIDQAEYAALRAVRKRYGLD